MSGNINFPIKFIQLNLNILKPNQTIFPRFYLGKIFPRFYLGKTNFLYKTLNQLKITFPWFYRVPQSKFETNKTVERFMTCNRQIFLYTYRDRQFLHSSIYILYVFQNKYSTITKKISENDYHGRCKLMRLPRIDIHS